MLLASSAHKDSIHQLSDAVWGRWLRGLDRSASPDLSGVCRFVKGVKEGGGREGLGGEECANLSSLTPATPNLSNQR